MFYHLLKGQFVVSLIAMLKLMKEEHYSELLVSLSERPRLLVCYGCYLYEDLTMGLNGYLNVTGFLDRSIRSI